MAINHLDRICEMIKQLSAHQKRELYDRLGFTPKQGKEKFLNDLTGIASGPKNRGSHTYKEDLYGGPRPL